MPNHDKFNLTIKNLNGQLLYKQTISGKNTEKVDLSSFEKGIYLIQLENDSQVLTQKLLKE